MAAKAASRPAPPSARRRRRTARSSAAGSAGAETAPQRPVDLRSDTLTQPTDAMRRAMADAAVGDDVYGEDPTVNRLQDEAARLLGTEAALLFPTGTMANQAALWAHTGRSGQAIVEENCHIVLYEGGGAATLANVTLRTVPGLGGTGVFAPADIERLWTPDDPHFAPTRLVAIENTHNWSGGTCWSAAQTGQIVDAAHARGVPVHIDGARIFNAAVAQRTSAKRLAARADSVMVALSKGLCAPAGSLLCGSKAVVQRAHAARKVLGGGMRQAGHLAAAGLVALRDGIGRLGEDHANARRLADGLSGLGLRVLGRPQTNMVMVDAASWGMGSAELVEAARLRGVLCLNRDAGPVVRFVTHRDVGKADVEEALRRLAPLGRRS